MTVARDLAEFLTRTSSADLPSQAVEHAAMLLASTLASALWVPGWNHRRSSVTLRVSGAEFPRHRCGSTHARNCRHPMPPGSTP